RGPPRACASSAGAGSPTPARSSPPRATEPGRAPRLTGLLRRGRRCAGRRGRAEGDQDLVLDVVFRDLVVLVLVVQADADLEDAAVGFRGRVDVEDAVARLDLADPLHGAAEAWLLALALEGAQLLEQTFAALALRGALARLVEEGLAQGVAADRDGLAHGDPV